MGAVRIAAVGLRKVALVPASPLGVPHHGGERRHGRSRVGKARDGTVGLAPTMPST